MVDKKEGFISKEMHVLIILRFLDGFYRPFFVALFTDFIKSMQISKREESRPDSNSESSQLCSTTCLL
ncbi:hypothetical protein D3H55_00440 [Bacillus salacetis]|uniref:Uncharacterized protein n=1 Tax=Bacillus salacetis TaxID=2315464 RepID=A0A3A1R6P1_9BACI|nr:hypothetical protein D3H55_00440 [Bacillus salacetis]